MKENASTIRNSQYFSREREKKQQNETKQNKNETKSCISYAISSLEYNSRRCHSIIYSAAGDRLSIVVRAMVASESEFSTVQYSTVAVAVGVLVG